MSRKDPPPVPIAEALRTLRKRKGLTQTDAGRIDGAPDHRTLSHWETGRKAPSLRLLTGYLRALGLDFHDLQDTLDQVDGSADRQVDELAGQVDRLARVAEDLGERRLPVLERRSVGMGNEIREAAERFDEIARELTRLAERIEALESREPNC